MFLILLRVRSKDQKFYADSKNIYINRVGSSGGVASAATATATAAAATAAICPVSFSSIPGIILKIKTSSFHQSFM